MSARGPYAKGVAKREEILAVALDLIARVGYSNATVRQIADAVGSTPTRVIYYFGSKELLFEEVLRRRDAEQTGIRSTRPASLDVLAETISSLLRDNAEVPGLLQLDTRLRMEASDGAHSANQFFRDRYEGSRWAVTDAFRGLQEQGELAANLDPERLAEMLLALIDGLQAHSLYDHAFDLTAPLQAWFAMVEAMSQAALLDARAS